MTRHCAFVGLLFLVTGVLFVTGCLDLDYNPDNDIILIKVTSAGTLEWVKVFDTGRNDEAFSINQSSDGGFYVLGKTADENHFGVSNIILIKYSNTGELLWTTTDMNSFLAESKINGWDHRVNRSWYDNEKYGWIPSYAEMRNNQGYLFPFVNNSHLFIVHLDQHGQLVNSTLAGQNTGYPPSNIFSARGEYAVLYFNTTNAHYESVLLDEKGNVTKIQTLINATAHCIPTNDAGFFCAELRSDDGKKSLNPFEGQKTTVVEKKLDADGILMWEQSVTSFCKAKAMNNIGLNSLIQTSDGGYVILASRDNFFKC